MPDDLRTQGRALMVRLAEAPLEEQAAVLVELNLLVQERLKALRGAARQPRRQRSRTVQILDARTGRPLKGGEFKLRMDGKGEN